MKNNDIENYNESVFESINHINDYGQEYWSARELAKFLDYKDYRNFLIALDKAMEACQNSGFHISDHFGETTEMVHIGSNAMREISTYRLSRYACYLIVQNANPEKEIVALGQTYFAIKTRQQELIENYDELTEEQKRLAICKEMKTHNKALADAAHNAGVVEPIDYAIFQNYGYQGLYGGMGRKEIHAHKGLKKVRIFWIIWVAQN
ncbi:DNA damage-inducible protein D [Anaerotignum sp.]|uniref:DNA damage-inducible protein D n=1 Tax=Anaerotignum sp. TaxID=2039241 RepID=UPI002ECFEDDB